MFLEWPIFSEDDFTEKCRNLYFCTTGYSPAHFVIVNSGLYFLFAEQSDTAPDHEAAELRRYASMCRSNFERALEKLHLLITPTLEACQALIFGVFAHFNLNIEHTLISVGVFCSRVREAVSLSTSDFYCCSDVSGFRLSSTSSRRSRNPTTT